MIFWIAVLFILYLIWLLFVKGYLFKLILFFGGWVGIYLLLLSDIPESAHTAIIIAGHNYSWAIVIPTIICLLTLLTTKE